MNFRKALADRANARKKATDSLDAENATRRALVTQEAQTKHDAEASIKADAVAVEALSKKGVIVDTAKGVYYTVVGGDIAETLIVGIDDDLDGAPALPPVDVAPAPIEEEPFDTSGIPVDAPAPAPVPVLEPVVPNVETAAL